MNEMRKLMETASLLDKTRTDLSEQIRLIDADDLSVEEEGFPLEDYNISDWKEVSSEFFNQLSSELENFGLHLEILNYGDDQWYWKITR